MQRLLIGGAFWLLLVSPAWAAPATAPAAAGATPLWTQDNAPTSEALALLEVLRHADDEGLDPDDYEPGELARLERQAAASTSTSTAPWQPFDLLLTRMVARYVRDLHCGRVPPRLAGFELPDHCASFDVDAQTRALATAPATAAVLAGLEPPFLHYRLLRQALIHYRQLELTPGAAALRQLPPLPGRSVKPGQRYAGAPSLRRLLELLEPMPPAAATGADSSAASADPLLIDPALVTALQRFQASHGLNPDGVLGRDTYAALVTPLAQRVRQIEYTLERWRWLPPLQGPTIIVNIPQFRLFEFDAAPDQETGMLRMDVIVGREYPRTRTPVFDADLRYIVFRPYWDVPRSILVREILPLLASDPHYLEAQHLELVRGQTDQSPVVPPTPDNLAALSAGTLRLRQQPGPDNALGLIKFLLPNAHDVYLHSTPAVHLFQQARRAFSHGCIRLSAPVDLAVRVLAGTPGDWTRDRVLAAMNGDRTFKVALARPVHVLVVYGTAVAAEDGSVRFFDDLYGQDRKLARLLAAARR